MKSILRITFRFIQPFPQFHGRADADMAEWPPSPMRAYQAMLNAACYRQRGKPLADDVRSAFEVLESIQPAVITPRATASQVGYRAYVPHNQADLVTAAWHRGNVDESIAKYRMEKDIRPMCIAIEGEEIPAIHYLYTLDTGVDALQLLAAIRPVVRSVHCLGWGIDQVIADAELHEPDIDWSESGECWRPVHSGGSSLRVPISGSLDALTSRHEKFLHRLVDNYWTPVPPLTAFSSVAYRRDTDPEPRPFAVFKLVNENDDTDRYPHAKLVHIAGMVRHLALKMMSAESGNPPPWIKDPAAWVNRVVRGKRDESSTQEHRQFSYIPLASIGHAHADAMIRNVMIVAPAGMDRELNYLAEQMDGQQLQPEGEEALRAAATSLFAGRSVWLQKFNPPSGKFIRECYLGTSQIWKTVTPIILDGHNKKSKNDTAAAIHSASEKLILKALQRAGIQTPCRFSWQSFPYFKNCLSAHKYDKSGRHTGYHRPGHLKDLTALHVQIEFDHPISGPLAIGAGRHCGFGLMACDCHFNSNTEPPPP